MLRTKIKASAITNLTDARYFAAWEVEWLGFDLDPASESFIKPMQVEAIKEWVEGPKITGEFNLQSYEEIEEAAAKLDLDAVQVGMLTPLETLTNLDLDVPVIKEIIVQAEHSPADLEAILQEFAPQVQYFLLDFQRNGFHYDTLQSFHFSQDWLREQCASYSILLSIDFDPDKTNELLEHLQPAGLSIRGGEEEKVGVKLFDDIDDIFEALETFE